MHGVEPLAAAKQTEDRTPISSIELGWPPSYTVFARLPRRTRYPGFKQLHDYFHTIMVPLELQFFQSKLKN